MDTAPGLRSVQSIWELLGSEGSNMALRQIHLTTKSGFELQTCSSAYRSLHQDKQRSIQDVKDYAPCTRWFAIHWLLYGVGLPQLVAFDLLVGLSSLLLEPRKCGCLLRSQSEFRLHSLKTSHLSIGVQIQYVKSIAWYIQINRVESDVRCSCRQLLGGLAQIYSVRMSDIT